MALVASVEVVPEEEIGTLRRVYRNFTTPSDDANFNPPKFASWRGRPKVLSLYGLSSWTFLITAGILFYIWKQCADAGEHFAVPYACSSGPVEGFAYVVVSLTSFFGDVYCLGRKSYWHMADRWLAQVLITGNVLLVSALARVGADVFMLSIVAYMVPLFCYQRSYSARKWELYEVWHTMWHAMSQTNKSLLSALLYVSNDGDDELTEFCTQMTAMVLCIEVLVCGSVWAHVDLFMDHKSEESLPSSHAEALLK